ncbi:lipid A deacylase LpxR family protein [Phenylobacterium sp. J367]|uniref:lipid A deacylase LpxR family protein n=1 Tax=Phenylobacterium sp. J367 TaxID=2898435 RepID=UPI002151FE16|nr:lipid A deacylase LpxR family protein [Phenylobacterium sp. J367]MCR5877746.1 lipid A deacylase LpxR family protein [Phenylobacterium sp. J367]
MRRLAFVAIVLSCGGAGAASAQSFVPNSQAQALNAAAFAERDVVRDDGQALRFSASQVQLPARKAGAVDSLRVSVGGVLDTPPGLVLSPDRSQFEARDVDVSLIRTWPNAVSFEAGKFDVDLSPHAGLGMGNRGGSAEAGAELRLSAPKTREERAVEQLKDMGVGDGAAFGDRGRWYLFAAASGRAVGMNMLRNEGDWDRAGWTTDATSQLVGDAQVGVGWRKGSVQTSFGVVHREVRGENMIFGQKTTDDTVAAFTFAIRPGQ